MVRGASRTVPPPRHLAKQGDRSDCRRLRRGGCAHRRSDGGKCRRSSAAGPLGDVRRHFAVVARRDAAGGIRAVATQAGGGLRRRRDAVLRTRQRDHRHPARTGPELAGVGVDGIRRRTPGCRSRHVGCLRRGAGSARRHAALVRRDGRRGGAVRWAGADRAGGHRPADRAHGAAFHQPGHRDLDQRAGRSAGRRAGPAGVLPLSGAAGRPCRAAKHRCRAAVAIGQPAR